ncbi:putative phycoerythrobilin lyase CpeS [Microcystis aeruginosa NIES-2520]|jgi:phycoerythrin-associated linker protein|uniref:Chromophore lyase CpcS/CpeS n=1 Tax=Microcystis aeruginosa NIES-2520 TaxID=2303982 RepID=A0A5A5RXA5_MICAE|nr:MULTISPECIES: phycobiliprotein lyase [Microcystis]NCR75707.1 phycobiliprotein lyase [Microcystis aeruginosa K13-06]MCA2668595.1 phycobiliprotein lyase [Microcystis sp. M045S2]MCA2713011.1 phycobiliprotein lyase [Microcystis sp. M172S2]MCA2802960.1 phycobiliprotein lyase [Microcystis sp. M114S2]MCA2833121.1 phycobiliprotein lyase [Microcystis sp. M007S1]
MDIRQFVELSLGRWRSQRSAHHLAFTHFEQVKSTIDIVPLKKEEQEVIDLCKSYDIDANFASNPFRMSWQGESDWDDESTFEGTTILIPIPDENNPRSGRLLRDQGYAETIPSIGRYHFQEDGTFVLLTEYERATAEEKIWFVNPNFRLRVSLIKTSEGTGVVTASFSSEIRNLSVS